MRLASLFDGRPALMAPSAATPGLAIRAESLPGGPRWSALQSCYVEGVPQEVDGKRPEFRIRGCLHRGRPTMDVQHAEVFSEEVLRFQHPAVSRSAAYSSHRGLLPASASPIHSEASACAWPFFQRQGAQQAAQQRARAACVTGARWGGESAREEVVVEQGGGSAGACAEHTPGGGVLVARGRVVP